MLLNYKLDLAKNKYEYPFAKFQYYEGGKKYEKDARSYVLGDCELGIEWQFYKFVVLTAEDIISDRTFEGSAKPNNRQ